MATGAVATTPKCVIMVCNTCGSEDVVVDAWATWDVEKQQWKLAGTLDFAHCNNCEGECSIAERLA